MDRNPYAPAFEDLPETLAVFPLRSAFLLPTGNLPLNIFEPRYVQMIEDALSSTRMIGIIQPAPGTEDDSTPALSKTGCAGKIVEFAETSDGRYEITLAGLYRFDVGSETETPKMYRVVEPNWTPYKDDHKAHHCLDLDRARLKDLLQTYFKNEGMDCDWLAVDNAPDGKLITCLSMVCPFNPQEKQALLEAACCKSRAELFLGMLEMAVKSKGLDSEGAGWH